MTICQKVQKTSVLTCPEEFSREVPGGLEISGKISCMRWFQGWWEGFTNEVQFELDHRTFKIGPTVDRVSQGKEF